MKEFEKVVPDTSIIIEGILSEKIGKEFKIGEIIIHNAVVSELEHQANNERAIGYLGIDELKALKSLSDKGVIKLSYKGKKPSATEIKYASIGEIDSLIRELAYDEGATLFSGDRIQARIAEVRGMSVEYIAKNSVEKKLHLDKFFDEKTMSVHLKEGVEPYAKKGFPGKWEFVKLDNKVINQELLQDISREIIEEAKKRRDSFVEIERAGSTIVQLGYYRIVILRPPFADGWEITAVRPVKKLRLEEYNLFDKLRERFESHAEGILIAGAPGHGKCLPANTLLYKADFTSVTIKQVYDEEIDCLLGVNSHGDLDKVNVRSSVMRIAGDLQRIKTRIGREIEATSNHPLLKFNEDSGEIEWTDICHLIIGDKIAVPRQIKTEFTNDTIDWLSFFQSEKTFCLLAPVDINVPILYKYINKSRLVIEAILGGCVNVNEVAESKKLNKKYTSQLVSKFVREGVITKIKGGKLVILTPEFNLKDYNQLMLNDIKILGLENKVKILRVATVTSSLNRVNFIKLPYAITPELCRLFGYYYSEGGGSKFSFTNTSVQLVEDFKICLREVFGISEPKCCKITTYPDLYASLESIMRNLGCSLKLKQKSRNMSLPQFLMCCSKDNLSNFLGAYFDGDGCVNTLAKSIEYYTSSECAAKQLVRLLLRIGVMATLLSSYKKGCYRYTISIQDKRSIFNFYNAVPLRYKSKDDLYTLSKKEYTQGVSYDLSSLLHKLSPLVAIKKQTNLSLERGFKITNLYHRLFFDFVSKADVALGELRSLLAVVFSCEDNFLENKMKFTSQFLTKNGFDHWSLHAWNNGRKMSLKTLNKLNIAIGNKQIVEPSVVSQYLRKTLNVCGLSATEVAEGSCINQATFCLRLTNGWNFGIFSLLDIFTTIEELYARKCLSFEREIEKLDLLFNSDIMFDKVTNIEVSNKQSVVYDIETDTHNFLAGELPVVVHNSTFASALAIHYSEKGKIVKTIEAPRDLVLPENVTQLAMSHGDDQEIHDIMLLTRPDYTFFDEMRNTKDFLLYSDLRLSGVGLVGVMHATKPVDAIQRFVGRIELGVIPHVIDTVIFIKNGQIEKVLNLEMTVKVPSGMTEADLARPVVTVSDFETGRLEVEIYSYGEETVVIPVSEIKDVENPLKRLAEKEIERSLHDYTNKVKVVIISDGRAEVYVPSESIARIIGKEGKTVSELEKQFGLKLDIRELSEKVHIVKQHKENVSFEVSQSSGNLNIFLPREYAESEAEIVVDGRYLLAAAVSKKGVIKLRLNSKIGQTLANDLKARRRVEVLV